MFGICCRHMTYRSWIIDPESWGVHRGDYLLSQMLFVVVPLEPYFGRMPPSQILCGPYNKSEMRSNFEPISDSSLMKIPAGCEQAEPHQMCVAHGMTMLAEAGVGRI